MNREVEDEKLLREDNFRNQVFANDPNLYMQLWGDEYEGNTLRPTEDVEEFVPEGPEDVEEMLREFSEWAGI